MVETARHIAQTAVGDPDRPNRAQLQKVTLELSPVGYWDLLPWIAPHLSDLETHDGRLAESK